VKLAVYDVGVIHSFKGMYDIVGFTGRPKKFLDNILPN
jgi:hypothetical protein